MTDIIQELRGLIAREKDARHCLSLPGDPAWPIEQDRKKSAQAALQNAAVRHLPALLDRLEAAERRVDFLDMRRPINGIECRSNEEVFAIMADRIRLAEAGHYRLPAIREVKP